jgi:hypothetical protein
MTDVAGSHATPNIGLAALECFNFALEVLSRSKVNGRPSVEYWGPALSTVISFSKMHIF